MAKKVAQSGFELRSIHSVRIYGPLVVSCGTVDPPGVVPYPGFKFQIGKEWTVLDTYEALALKAALEAWLSGQDP